MSSLPTFLPSPINSRFSLVSIKLYWPFISSLITFAPKKPLSLNDVRLISVLRDQMRPTSTLDLARALAAQFPRPIFSPSHTITFQLVFFFVFSLCHGQTNNKTNSSLVAHMSIAVTGKGVARPWSSTKKGRIALFANYNVRR